MRRTPDVVIVGGGIIGASIAYHLTKKGVRDVLVLERDRLGSGSTGKNAGGIRLQFSSEINVKLSQRSLPHIERFADEIGTDPDFHQVGYLFLITEDRDVAAFENDLRTHKVRLLLYNKQASNKIVQLKFDTGTAS